MHEVESLAVDVGDELRKGVERRLLLTPVERIAPVLDQVTRMGKGKTRLDPTPGGSSGQRTSVSRRRRSSRSAWGTSMRNGLISVMTPR
jgi:hypothetical protein